MKQNKILFDDLKLKYLSLLIYLNILIAIVVSPPEISIFNTSINNINSILNIVLLQIS